MSALREQHMDSLRKAAFPTPSSFGVEWEKQRATEAYALIHRCKDTLPRTLDWER